MLTLEMSQILYLYRIQKRRMIRLKQLNKAT